MAPQLDHLKSEATRLINQKKGTEAELVSSSQSRTDFYQIYYDDVQESACYPFARLYFNEKVTIFFENSVIVPLVMYSKAEKVSVCSWKLRQKLKYYIGRRRELTQEVLESDYDVLSMTKNSKHHQMLAFADKSHPGFKSTFNRILSEIGINVPKEVSSPIYQNHFSAKTEIYQDYVKTYLKPAMDVMFNDPEINKMIMVDSNYTNLDRTSANRVDALKEQIGVGYYPLAPFLLERLFSVYVHNRKINVTWL